MLKRNKMLVAFMLVAVLCMSIGFAAVSDTLTADGKVSVDWENTALEDQFDANVKFTAVSDADVLKIDKDANNDEADKVTITVPKGKLTTAGSTYEVTATITNTNTAAATLTVDKNTQTIADGCVKVDFKFADSSIEATNGTELVTITFTLIKAPATAIENVEFTAFTITATPAA